MTPERLPLPPNTISLCSPWLPKNEMQGHFSIYCRLFSPGVSSNSLRNLLEVSCNIFHSIIYLRNLLECSAPVTLIAELDFITRALGILSGQPPSSRPLLTNSDPLITLLQRMMLLPMDTPLGVADALGYLQHHLQELTECQSAS